MKKTLVILVIVALCLVATQVSTSFAAPNHGFISIAFDDAAKSQYDYAFPLLQSRGMVGTFYVITDRIRDFSYNISYMSMAELRDLQGNGSEIGSHSKTHRNFLSLTDAQIRYECSSSKQVLQSNGLTVENFAYPYGDTNDHIDSIVSQYYRSGRTAHALPYIMQTIQFKLAGVRGETGNSTVLTHLKNMVDQVYSTNGWAVIFFHNIIPDVNNASYTISTQDFTSFLDYVISKGVQTLTVNQALNLPTSTLTMATNYGTVSPVSGQYINGTRITISADPPATGPGERYTWLGWTGSGTSSYTGLKNIASVWMEGPISQTASWRCEYYLNVTSPYGNPGGQGWYDAGSSAYATLESGTVSGGTGIRYVFTGWSGDASGTDLTSDAITMNGPKTATANWKTQYYLTVISAHDSPTPASSWFDAGASVTASVTSPGESSGTRYSCTSWTGTGSVPASGTDTKVTFKINTPSNLTWNWKTQYYLKVDNGGYGTASGEGWYESGTSATFSIDPTSVYEGVGKRYVFTYWSGNSTSTNPSDNILMNEPKTVTANWKTQYQVTLGETGLDSAATGTVVTVDGSAKTSSDLPFSKWVDSGSSVTYTYADLVTSSVSGSQFKLSSVTGPVSSITVSGATSVTASYKTQYEITFGQSRVDSDFAGTLVTVDGADYARSGVSFWWDSGSSHSFAFQSQLAVGAIKRYVWLSTAGLSTQQTGFVTASASGAITANYKTQYYLNVVSPQGTSGGTGWYDSGATAHATLSQSIVNASSGVRYVFAGWSGDASGAALTSNPITVNRSMSPVASWKKQFLVVFNQTGLPDGFEANIAVNSANQTLPYSIWIDEGAIVQFAYDDKLPDGFGRQCVLTSTSNKSPLNVESPITVTAQYTFQYTIEMYVAIAIPAVLVVLAIGIVLLKRRKRPDKILRHS